MHRLLSAIQRLNSAAGIAEGGRLGKLLDPSVELREFDERLQQLRNMRTYDERSQPPLVDIEELLQRWNRVRPNLSTFRLRDIRAMCWDARTAADEQFVKGLIAADHIPRRLPMLRGLWHAHQVAWRLGTASRIETQIKAAASRAGYRPRWLESVRKNPDVLSDKAPAVLLRVLGDGWDVEPVFRMLGITSEGQLGQQVVDAAIERWLRQVIRLSMLADSCAIVHEGHKTLLLQSILDLDRFRKVVNRLLLQIPKGSKAYRTAVATLILSDERLGHPKRVATRGNWIGFSDDAIRIAVQLFAARDLGAFFEILIERGDDEQRRRAFWERYVESPQLVNFAIACDTEDMKRLIARGTKERATAATLADAPPHHSAFIMQFKGRDDVTLVEMSQGGNALYVFTSQDFEHHVGSLEDRAFRFRALKNKDLMLDRWTHRWPWHERFSQELASLGIYTGRFA